MSLKTKIRVKLGLIAILLIFSVSLLLSQRISPNIIPLFALKRVQEKVFLSLKPGDSERLDYMSYLLDNRLGELKYLVYSKNYSYVLPSSLRYSTLAGQITDLILTNNLNHRAQEVENKFLKHKQFLKEIYDYYPKNTDNVEYKYIEDDINYLDLYLNKLSKI